MTDYKNTGKYDITPTGSTTSKVRVGSQAKTGYSGRSTRVDDNFTYLAGVTGGPTYGEGTAISIDTDHNISVILGTDSATKAAPGNHTHTYSTITGALTAGSYINISTDNKINVLPNTLVTALPEATTEVKGLLSASDKDKLDGISSEANKYILPVATTSTLGGVIINPDYAQGNLTISSTGVLSARDTTYEDAVAPSTGVTGSHGLMTASDKAKLTGIAEGATNVSVPNEGSGFITINNNQRQVYQHPAYTSHTAVAETGKVVKDITIDDTGHVTTILKGNESGITLAIDGDASGNIIEDAQYALSVLTLTKKKLGDAKVKTTSTLTTWSDIEANDTLVDSLKKLQLRADAKLHYRGTIGTNGDFESISVVSPKQGDVYKVVTQQVISTNETAISGDLLIYHNNNWVLIPSGIRNTWRPVYVGTTLARTSEPDSGNLKFVDGTTTQVIWDEAAGAIHFEATGGGGGSGVIYTGGTGITITTDGDLKRINCIYTDATSSTTGLFSATDKAKLDTIATGATAITVDATWETSSTNPVQSQLIQSALAGKANTSHTHIIDNITGLQDALDSKATLASIGTYNSTTKTLTIK